MAKTKLTSANLEDSIERLLKKYNTITTENIDKVCKKVAQRGRTALKNDSTQFDGAEHWGQGSYSSGWRVSDEKNLWFHTYIIHNATRPTETHLLECGHDLTPGVKVPPKNRNKGGRWITVKKSRAKATPHITPVGDTVMKEFEEGVKSAIQSQTNL